MPRNREAGILAKTFKDHLSVYRKQKKMNPQTLATVEEEAPVYEDIPCALSQKGNNVPDRQEFHSESKRDYTLFTVPGVELLDNDRAVVQTEAGQTFEGKTGKTFSYVSHGETPFGVEKIT